jgi:hypothetical protein
MVARETSSSGERGVTDLSNHVAMPPRRAEHRRSGDPVKASRAAAHARRRGVPLWLRALIIVSASAGLWALIIVGVLALIRG